MNMRRKALRHTTTMPQLLRLPKTSRRGGPDLTEPLTSVSFILPDLQAITRETKVNIRVK